jgi:hypothetical protein
VIGNVAVGNGSNTTTIGHTTITDAYIRGNIRVASSRRILNQDGTAALPAYGWENNTNMGTFRPADGVMAWSTGGVERGRISSAGLQLGTAGTTQGNLLMAGSTSGLITLKGAAAAGTWTLTLPTTAGTSGQMLRTDGSGVTTWVTPIQDTQYIYLVAVPAGTAVTQTAGTLFQSAVTLIPEHLDGYTVRRADYALLNNTSSTGDLYIGLRRQSTTNTTVSSNNMAGTFTGSAVRASSTSALSVSKNQWLRVEVHPSIAGTLDGTVEGLICTLMLTK